MTIAEGTRVAFREDFSANLIGLVFETVGEVRRAAPTHGEDGYEYIMLRIRVGKSQRWNYRSGRISDLVLLDEQATDARTLDVAESQTHLLDPTRTSVSGGGTR
jgi:hypothetical protein